MEDKKITFVKYKVNYMSSRLAWIFIVFFPLLFVFQACKHDPVVQEDAGVCFDSQILPIFQSSCALPGCHDNITSADGYNFSSYVSIMSTGSAIKANNPGDSKVVRYITEDDEDKIMPPPPKLPLSQIQIDLIIQWINQGAKNTTNCGVICDANTFAFAADIQPILQTHCTGCHAGANPDAGINLSNHAGVAVVANNGRLLGSINHQAPYSQMPKNAPKLSDCKISKITSWIDNGAPNN